MDYICKYASPLGGIVLVSDGSALTGLYFADQKHVPEAPNVEGERFFPPVFAETTRWLDLYFEGKNPDFTPPLSLVGSAFRLEVWSILRNIPYGKTVTYGAIAKKTVRKPGQSQMSAQAVGGAVGHNPISLIVPCHRVVGSNGNLTGYAGGMGRKIFLLELEQVDMSPYRHR